MNILGIESSCDETAAAVLSDGKLLSNAVLSQEIHKAFGGVVPEVASREHDAQIFNIMKTALSQAQLQLKDIDGIAVTYGAGLLGALLVGLNFAKGLAIGLNIPFVGVNHLEGHLYANSIDNSGLKYPFICMLVTGGHTQIWEVLSPGNYILHCTTVDDAAGEAFDKGARILGLEYPGGPAIEKLARNGNSNLFDFPIPKMKHNPFNYSFSGLKTALLYKCRKMEADELNENRHHIAAAYQEAILDTLFHRLQMVVDKTSLKQISITGGVAANGRFRKKSQAFQSKNNLNIFFPRLEYCTDNAAMIAMAGYEQLKNGKFSPLSLKANPNLALNESAAA